jgi:hypothetical protein
MTEVSATRLYLGNLPRNATKAEVEAHFQTHGTGEITEVKLMNGFGFIEYKDAMDARDVVPGKCMMVLPIQSIQACANIHIAFRTCPLYIAFAVNEILTSN